MVVMMTGNGHDIVQSIYEYGLDEGDKKRILEAINDFSNTDDIQTLVEKTLNGIDTPDNLSIIQYDEDDQEILKNQVLKALEDGKTVIAGEQEEIDKIINNL